MHDGMPYGRNQGQGQRHSREVHRQSPTGLIFIIVIIIITCYNYIAIACLCDFPF